MGLNEGADKWLAKHCIHTNYIVETKTTMLDWQGNPLPKTTTTVTNTCKKIHISNTNNFITGMFEEQVHELVEYVTIGGSTVEEYIQAEPWSSGPVIFLALRFKETKEPIRQSLWSEDDIDNA
jgi:hypothetical protein